MGQRIVSFALERYSRYCPATNPGFNSTGDAVNTNTQMEASGAAGGRSTIPGKVEPYAWSHLSAPHSLILTMVLDHATMDGKHPFAKVVLLLLEYNQWAIQWWITILVI
jgi:hypothetical protein